MDIHIDKKPFSFSSFIFWVIASFFLLPWIYVQYNTSINSDVSWLSICANRLLGGVPLSQGCFDTNPPLNVLIYAPFILISEFMAVELYRIIFFGTILIALAFTLLTNQILKFSDAFSKNERSIIILSFLCSITIIPSIYFAERDHFIAMGLLPFILAQTSITNKKEVPALLIYLILFLGGIIILIKPHFGIIPVFLFMHRAYINKCVISVIKSPDFVILFLLSVAYIIGVFVFFQDFVDVILPDILKYYLPYNNPYQVYLYAKVYGFITIILFLISFLLPKVSDRKIVTLLSFCAILSLVVYIIQMKGFTYHKLPLYSLIFPIGFLMLYKFSKFRSLKLFIPLIFAVSYVFSPLVPSYASHETYKNSELMRYINDNCDDPCSYFITHENMDIISQIAFYSGYNYASRFPSFWFHNALKDKQEKLRFASYIAQDITNMSPSLLLIQQQNIDLLEYYSVSDDFKNAIKTYKKVDELRLDRAHFYQGTKYDFEHLLSWDVYKKYE